MEKCVSYCTCERFDFKNLVGDFEKKHKVTKYKNVLLITEKNWICYVFDYWSIVAWWVDYDNIKRLLEDLSIFEINSYDDVIREEFYYEEKSRDKVKIANDIINLTSDDSEEKLAVSHGIAQSIKLVFFENKVENTIKLSKNIPKDLKEKWDIKLSKKQISKMRWELFLTKSSVNLDYELLDEPEFFWEYPELSDFYKTTSNYLDIKTRIEVLNKKLEVIHELFQMLSDEQNHKHSSILEWIIIWLIVIEITFTILHDVLKLF